MEFSNPVSTNEFVQKLIHYFSDYETICVLNSNDFKPVDHPCGEGKYDFLAAVGVREEITANENCVEKFKNFFDNNVNKWKFGYFTYDLKNEIEKLSSVNRDGLQFPALHFFVPEIIIISLNGKIRMEADAVNSQKLFEEIINDTSDSGNTISNKLGIKNRILREEYNSCFEKIASHIQRGDIYEMNYCQEFYAENAEIIPEDVYERLCKISPAPFSSYYKNNEYHLLSASPERFLKKTGSLIISQPIKGTAARSTSKEEDDLLKNNLRNSEKERSENVMIVDLVRNDLSRIAGGGSVKVDELFGIYSYSQVHQMISTVSCEVKENIHPVEIIKSCFPMGSMTGAPKISAMKIIEEVEATKRGLYSGSIGYFTPDGDFDFNVIIRSILYNSSNRYLSFMTGGAITAKSVAEEEYNECLLKARGMMKALEVIK